MRHRRAHTAAAPAPPPGSLNPPEVVRQSTIMTPFKVYDVRMTEQDRTYCTSLARKLTGDEAHWLLWSFLRFFAQGQSTHADP